MTGAGSPRFRGSPLHGVHLTTPLHCLVSQGRQVHLLHAASDFSALQLTR